MSSSGSPRAVQVTLILSPPLTDSGDTSRLTYGGPLGTVSETIALLAALSIITGQLWIYLPRRAADIWWRSEGFPWSRPCSRRPPDALCLDSAAQIPWWGHRSPACYWLWSPRGGLPCAGTPWPGGWSRDRGPQQAGLAAGRWSQSGWRRGRTGCHCLLWGSERCVLLLLLGSFSGINHKLWITWEVDVGHIGAFMVPVTLRTVTHYDPAAVGTRVSSRGRRQDQLTVFVSVFNAAGGRKKHGRCSDLQRRSRTADASDQHLRRESLKVSR